MNKQRNTISKRPLSLFLAFILTLGILGTMTPETVQASPYTLTLTADSGGAASISGGGATASIEEGDSVTITATADPGYAFVSWNVISAPPGFILPNDTQATTSFTMPGDTVDINARIVPEYTINYDANGGTGYMAPDTIILIGAMYTIRGNEFIYPGHTFAEWNTEADGNGTTVDQFTSFPVTGNSMTLYAQWQTTDIEYTITYDGNATGVTGAPAAETVIYLAGYTISSSTPTKLGYDFTGWNAEADGSGTDYAPGDTISSITANMTFYAQWQQAVVPPHTITYDGNASGVTGIPAAEMVNDGAGYAVSPSTPGRAGYTFTSWNTQSNGSGTDYAPGETISSVAANITLYAQWRYTDSSSGESGSDDISRVIIRGNASIEVYLAQNKPAELIAGRLENTYTGVIVIEEKGGAVLSSGGTIRVALPEWVKITNIRGWSASGGLTGTLSPTAGATGVIDGTSNEFTIAVQRNSLTQAGSIRFYLDLSIECDKTGEIEAQLTGAGMEKAVIAIARAIAPVTVTADAKDGETELSDQEKGYILIEETAAGAIKSHDYADNNAFIDLIFPDNSAYFTSIPTVEVTEGDLKIDAVTLINVADVTNSGVRIAIRSGSTRPGTIKISDVSLSVGPAVSADNIRLMVGGNAIAENYYGYGGGYRLGKALAKSGDNSGEKTVDPGEFETWHVDWVTPARVIPTQVTPAQVTPATAITTTETPASASLSNVIRVTIDSATAYRNGEAATITPVAFIDGSSRLQVPVRTLANLLGMTTEQIIWRESDRTVTINLPSRTIQFTIGSDIMLVNGAQVRMDTEAMINNDWTFIPFRALGEALGVVVSWDDATKTATYNADKE